MRPGILPEHGFKHKGNHYASLPWFGTKIAQKHAIKGSKFSGFRRDAEEVGHGPKGIMVGHISESRTLFYCGHEINMAGF